MRNIGNKEIIVNFNKYKSLLSELVRRDIKIKYRRSVLGVLWSLLDPLFSMVILTIVFSTLFRRIESYPVYYLSGMLAYTLFASGSSYAMKSMVSSSGIWKTMYVPKYLYVVSAVLSNFVTYLLSLIVLFAIMLVLHVPFTIFIIFASLPIAILIVLTIGAGLVMATLNIFFRDMEHLYRVFTLMLMYAMPIFYPENIVPASFKFIQTYNPLYQIIVCLRCCFLYGQLYPMYPLLYSASFALILLVIGLALFYRYQDKFVLYV
ncbi:MAG: ABC transporter [Methanosphaera sp. rholeuAM74]|nr:MAG: ABC transporter [Methanosphaera sp. rholeuAM74]